MLTEEDCPKCDEVTEEGASLKNAHCEEEPFQQVWTTEQGFMGRKYGQE